MGKFDKNVGGPISKADADKKHEKWKKDKNKRKDIETQAVFIGRDWIEKLLAKDGCTGIWVNFGTSDNDKSMEPFFIAGDINGNYIMSDETKRSIEAATDDIINDTTQCPDDCPPNP